MLAKYYRNRLSWLGSLPFEIQRIIRRIVHHKIPQFLSNFPVPNNFHNKRGKFSPVSQLHSCHLTADNSEGTTCNAILPFLGNYERGAAYPLHLSYIEDPSSY